MGVKFQKFTALKSCTEIVTQISEPTRRPSVPVEKSYDFRFLIFFAFCFFGDSMILRFWNSL